MPDQNMECVFPFLYLGKTYFKCTSDYACPTCFWCGTKYNVDFSNGWGMCDKSKCPLIEGNFQSFYHYLDVIIFLLFRYAIVLYSTMIFLQCLNQLRKILIAASNARPTNLVWLANSVILTISIYQDQDFVNHALKLDLL